MYSSAHVCAKGELILQGWREIERYPDISREQGNSVVDLGCGPLPFILHHRAPEEQEIRLLR